MTDTAKNFEIPRGLNRKGHQAALLITKFLSDKGLLDSGGCPVFHHPGDWGNRGEDYGKGSILIVCHDGGDHSVAFDYDKECYKTIDELCETLDRIGCHIEQCTSWYSAIYED